MNKVRCCQIISILVVSMTLAVSLAEGQNLVSVDSVTKFQAIPNDVAFDLLGLPGNNIQQPGTISSFLASIQPAVNLRGELSPATAISFAPYQMFMGDRLQLYDYIRDPVTRILFNAQLSLGSASGLNADSSRDWAIGAKIVFLNSGDGRLDTNKLALLAHEGFEILSYLRAPEKMPSDVVKKIYSEARILIKKMSNYVASGNVSNDTLDRMRAELVALADRLQATDVSLKEVADNLRNKANDSHLYAMIKKIKEYGLKPDWNATTLDLDAGAVYRAFGSNIRQNAFSKFRIWINGGWGNGSSQFLGQIGFYRQYSLPGQIDSTYLTYALMYRCGNKDLRIGLGGNGIGGDKGTINLAAEIRLSSMGWIVASLNREFVKGVAPVWSPAISIKTSGGFWGL